jgi:hypothetical protein
MKNVVQMLTSPKKDRHLHRFNCEFDKVIEEVNNDLMMPEKKNETKEAMIHIGYSLSAYGGEQSVDSIPTTDSTRPMPKPGNTLCK